MSIVATKRGDARGAGGDSLFAGLNWAAGMLVLVLLGAIIIMLLVGGLPAFRAFGFGFITNTIWDPPNHIFSAGVAVYGTTVSAVLALIFAVPVSFGIAFYLTEIASPWLRRPIGTAVELLAGIPSIIYGMWGFFVIVPLMAHYVEPAFINSFNYLADTFDGVPVLGWLTDKLSNIFMGPAFGTGIFTAALILAIMIIPFIAATMRDVFLTVPAIYKESAYGLGCTTSEVMRRVVLPYTRSSVVGGIMLGLGRALGETMAVTFVIGNANHISSSIFANGNTIASLIALEFSESQSDPLRLTSLLACGFLLFVESFAVLAFSRYLLRPRRHA